MALDPTVIAALAGISGVVVNRLADTLLDRLKRKDALTLGFSQHVSEQSRLLFEQQGISIKGLWERIDEVERELREAEERAELAEDRARRSERAEQDLIQVRANFEDAKRRLAIYAAGGTPTDDPPYDLPYVRRSTPPK